jgi:hypothetical protein
VNERALNKKICSIKTWFPCEGGESVERKTYMKEGRILFALEREFQAYGKRGVNKKRLCMILRSKT